MKGIKALLIVLSLILITPFFTGVKANTTENNEATHDHNPILLIHGGFCTHMDWGFMRVRFHKDGWPNTSHLYAGYAYTFADPNNCSSQAIINNAHQIKQWVEDILNETGADKIDLVGHCMGGMSSRYYIKFLGGIDRVDDYVSLASPHHGSNWSSCGREGVKEIALILNEEDETPGGLLNDTLGIRDDPVWNLTYTGAHIPGSINYTSIYSKDNKIVQYISSPLDGAYNIEVEKLSHTEIRLDESVYELVRAAVDGTFPNATTLTSTPTTTTTSTAGLGPFSLLVAMTFLIPWHKRKK